MLVRSLYQPLHPRDRREGLPGAGPKKVRLDSIGSTKSFEEYLMEAFQGEVVQKGEWVSPRLSPNQYETLRNF